MLPAPRLVTSALTVLSAPAGAAQLLAAPPQRLFYISLAGLSDGVTLGEPGDSLEGAASGALGVTGTNCEGSGVTGAAGAAGASGAGAGDHEAG